MDWVLYDNGLHHERVNWSILEFFEKLQTHDRYSRQWHKAEMYSTAQKIKFSFQDFFSKCDQKPNQTSSVSVFAKQLTV